MTELVRSSWSTGSAWRPNGERALVVLTSAAFALAIAGLWSSQRTWAAFAMIIAVAILAGILIALLGAWVGSIVLLIVTCFVDQWVFPIGRVNIRPEQVAVLIAAVVWGWKRMRDGRLLDLRLTLPEVVLLGWFALGLVSSVIEAPSRIQSVKVWLLLGVSSLALFLVRRIVAEDGARIDDVLRWLLLAFAVESAYALGTYYIHAFGPTISLSFNPATQHLNAKGTLWEPNVLGGFAAAGAVLWSYVGPRLLKHPWIGVALCLGACIASYARAAWLAIAIVALLTFLTPVRKRLDLRAFGFGSLIGTLLAAIGIIAVEQVGTYTKASGGVSSSVTNSTDVIGRLYQFGYVGADFMGHPLRLLIGGGIDSFGERHIIHGVPEHLANLELFIFNDTGILGLALFVGFSLLVVEAIWRQSKDWRVLGLGAMMLVLVITNASTETLELMITWLMLGLVLASTGIAEISGSAPSRKAASIAS